MENPEEVLQALDEFQKMRPSEIPRELEEYLSWVAKTGDPVYQWSLVKPLFREKLTRVMTDFHESCPSLELAPCPNVDQFNYDIMKCNLLELLESFANAPFTVQRICELLTAPRKEYNRVDKFMRAIEKNILVVSTVEPGPAARRSENGDGMVNGSLDDETPSTQSSHDVEMDSWVKDCTSENSVAIPASDEDAQLLESVLPSGKPNKITSNQEIPQIPSKSEEASERTEVADPESSSQLVAPETVLTEQSEAELASRLESSQTEPAEVAVAGSQVPAGVMNEDTNSQPSLDSEPEAAETSSSPKLQTTFRTKDFVREDASGERSYAEIAKSASDKSELEAEEPRAKSEEKNEDETAKSTDDAEISFERQEESDVEIPEGLPEKRARIDRLIDDLETDNSSATINTPSEVKEKPEDSTSFLVDAVANEGTVKEMTETTIEGAAPESSEERLSAGETEKLVNEEEEKEVMKDDNATDSTEDSLPEAERASLAAENSKPIIEEPNSEEPEKESSAPMSEPRENQPESTVTIEEAMDDDTRVNKSMVPDPIPIIEEPKEVETSSQDEENSMTITELPEVVKESSEIAECAESTETTIVSTIVVEESSSLAKMSEELVAEVGESIPEDISDVKSLEEATIEEKIEPAESMEVDAEESLPGFQQDEPMEQESGDMVKS